MIDAPASMPIPHPWIKQTAAPRAVILMYHRIGNSQGDPQLLSVAPENFADHMQVLKQTYNVAFLHDLPQMLKQKELVSRTVFLTIDDGYKDLISEVLPVLKRLDLRMTAFLCGDDRLPQTEYWWDVLKRILLRPGTLPEFLEIDIQGHRMSWDLSDSASYSSERYEIFQDWTLWNKERPTVRHIIFRRLYGLMNFLAENEKISLLDQLKNWSGHTDTASEVLSREEIGLLARSGHMEIGGHTVSHPFLSRLPVSEQIAQIQQNKAFLESTTGIPITSFAYPFGSRDDYTDDTIQLLRSSGFTLACSSTPEVVWTGSSLMTLPRLLIRDSTGETFSRWLSSWF